MMADKPKVNITALEIPTMQDGFTTENIRYIFEEMAQQMALSPELLGSATPAVWNDVSLHRRRKFFKHGEKPYTRTKYRWTPQEESGA